MESLDISWWQSTESLRNCLGQSGGGGEVEWQSAGPPPQIDFQGRQIENQAGLENAEA